MFTVIGNLELKWLTFCRWFYQLSLYYHWWSNNCFGCVFKSFKFFLNGCLYTFETTSIIDLNKTYFFTLLSTTLHPSTNSYNLSQELFITLMDSSNTNSSTISHGSHYLLWNNIVSINFTCVCLWFAFVLHWGFTSCTKWFCSWGLVWLSISWPNSESIWVYRKLSGFVHFVVFCKKSKIQLIKCWTRLNFNFVWPIISSY